jgi:hypothetical protein
MADDVTEDLWFHGRDQDPVFNEDQPAFFAAERDDVEMWAGRGGVVLTAKLAVVKPAGEEALMRIAEEMGLEDVFDEEYSDFPDVSSYLYDERVRRRLEEEGYDSYRGEDGYLYVTVVWNPDLIERISLEPYWGAAVTAPTV